MWCDGSKDGEASHESPLWAPCPPLERSAPHLHTRAAPPRPSPCLHDLKFLGPSQSEHCWRMALQPGQTCTRHWCERKIQHSKSSRVNVTKIMLQNKPGNKPLKPWLGILIKWSLGFFGILINLWALPFLVFWLSKTQFLEPEKGL